MTLPRHWSDIDPGPLTDDQKHQRVIRLAAELDTAKAFRARLVAAADDDIAHLEAAITRTLAMPATAPTRRTTR